MAKSAKKIKRIKGKKFYNYKKRRGDRKDGWLIRASDPIFFLIPWFMKERVDSLIYFDKEIEIENLDKFMRAARRDESLGMPNLSRLMIIMAAIVRAVAKYPKVNRFVAGQRIYARNYLNCAMTIKRSMDLNASEAVIKPAFDPDYTLKEVYDSVVKSAEGYKGEEQEITSLDRLIGKIAKRRTLARLVVRYIKHKDNRKGLPKWALDFSPFHASVYIVDIGSTGIGPVYHHIYNIGTVSEFIVIGKKEKTVGVGPDGQPQVKNVLGMRFTVDERVCDGFYFAKFIRYFSGLMEHPEQLLERPAEVIEDPLV